MLLDIFDENLHPLSKSEVPPDYDKHDPEQKQIYRFVRTLFSAAQLTAECAIVTLSGHALESHVIPPSATCSLRESCQKVGSISVEITIRSELDATAILFHSNYF
uniref:Uncharacterized protein n=1 Tax=Meleagris gallopavo TaxID=9103 RepID=A0A803YRK6_MELGA